MYNSMAYLLPNHWPTASQPSVNPYAKMKLVIPTTKNAATLRMNILDLDNLWRLN